MTCSHDLEELISDSLWLRPWRKVAGGQLPVAPARLTADSGILPLGVFVGGVIPGGAGPCQQRLASWLHNLLQRASEV